jgi:hypothetical protein
MGPETTGAIVAIAIFLVGHLGVAIWFASSVSGQLKQLTRDMRDTVMEVKAIAKDATRISVLEQRVVTLEADMREARLSVRTMLSHQPGDVQGRD